MFRLYMCEIGWKDSIFFLGFSDLGVLIERFHLTKLPRILSKLQINWPTLVYCRMYCNGELVETIVVLWCWVWEL